MNAVSFYYQTPPAELVTMSHNKELAEYCADVCDAVGGVTFADICGPRRLGHITDARAVLMCVLHHEFGLTWVESAGFFGRTHATAINAARKVRSLVGLSIPDWKVSNLLTIAENVYKTRTGRPFTTLNTWHTTKKSV